jgi:DNA-binding NtrC family response regulator
VMRPTILLIEGAECARDAMKQSLEEEDLEVVSIKTTAEAARLIVAHPFDAVIADLHVPKDVDDLALLRAVRRFRPNALIVAVTDSLSVREAAMALRLDIDVIVKPFNVRQVAELIHRKIPRAKSPVCVEVDMWNAKKHRMQA